MIKVEVKVLKINALQGGLLLGTIMRRGESDAFFLGGIFKQLSLKFGKDLETEITLDPLQCGVLMSIIANMEDEEHRQILESVMQQLIDFKKEAEEREGVTKELLPDGQIKIRDRVGNCFIRYPMPWEIEG